MLNSVSELHLGPQPLTLIERWHLCVFSLAWNKRFGRRERVMGEYTRGGDDEEKAEMDVEQEGQ